MKNLIIIFGLIFWNDLFAQNILNDVSKGVGLISYMSKADGQFHWGTGTFIFKDSATGNYGHVYIITNKHVLPTFKDNNSIDFKIKKKYDNIDSFTIMKIPIFDNAGNYLPYIKFDPQGEDVCAIRMDNFYMSENLHYIDSFLLNYDLLIPKQYMKKIGIGEQIYFIGYPSYFFNAKNISPILRTGIVSSNPSEDYYYSKEVISIIKKMSGETLPQKLEGFMIDGNVFGGSSGSLVIYMPMGLTFSAGKSVTMGIDNRPYIMGIITMSFFDIGVSFPQHLNLATALSSDIIIRTIDSFQ